MVVTSAFLYVLETAAPTKKQAAELEVEHSRCFTVLFSSLPFGCSLQYLLILKGSKTKSVQRTKACFELSCMLTVSASQTQICHLGVQEFPAMLTDANTFHLSAGITQQFLLIIV